MEPVSPQLLERLLGQHAAALELYASQWSNSPEDCLQEAFIALASRRQAPRDAVAWLYGVVRKQAMKQHRSQQRRRNYEQQSQYERKIGLEVAQSVAETNEAISPQSVTAALEALPPDEREVIVARLWGGLTYEQISRVSGVSRSSVHRLYHRGLETLRQRLDVPCKKT